MEHLLLLRWSPLFLPSDNITVWLEKSITSFKQNVDVDVFVHSFEKWAGRNVLKKGNKGWLRDIGRDKNKEESYSWCYIYFCNLN